MLASDLIDVATVNQYSVEKVHEVSSSISSGRQGIHPANTTRRLFKPSTICSRTCMVAAAQT